MGACGRLAPALITVIIPSPRDRLRPDPVLVWFEVISDYVAEDPAHGGEPLTDFIRKVIGTAVKRCVHTTKISISTNVIERPSKSACEPPLIALIVAADEYLARETRQRELTKLGSQSGPPEVTSEIEASHLRKRRNAVAVRGTGHQSVNLGGPAKDFHPSSYQGSRVTRLRGDRSADAARVASQRMLVCPHLTQA
jgi:hypothetical protein